MIKILRTIFLSLFLLSTFALSSQNTGFHFFDKNKKFEDVNFKLINNIIVIPLEINGEPINFNLDTWVNKTIVFNSSNADTIFLCLDKKFQLRGLGKGLPVDAIVSNNNSFRIQNLVSNNQRVFIVLKDEFDLSAKMGMTIHGVIGYDLLKDLILRVNYKSKKKFAFLILRISDIKSVKNVKFSL
ncbi:MAG: retropepsin-like aspartic protease [Flavobacteriaceae bacterium]